MFGKGVGIIIDKPAPFPNIAQLSTIYHSKCRMSLSHPLRYGREGIKNKWFCYFGPKLYS